MKQTRFLQVLVMITLCGFGWALAQEDTVTVEAMKQLEQQWSEFFAQGDAVGRASLYAEDAISDNVNDQPVIGKEEIEAMYLSHIHLTFETTEAATFGQTYLETAFP